MDVQIKHNGTDITDYVLEYNRTKELCSGIGLLDISITKNVSRTFDPWDTITIYEEGSKRGEYNISTIARDSKSGNYQLECQDDSKRLVDYFVADSYTITTYSLTKYWIELILNMAGVNYTFDTAELGTPLNENSVVGVGSAYDVITPLLQQSGWYIYFDEDNLAHIGKIDKTTSHDDSFNDSDILSINTMKNDAMLRNRAVVWGAGDAYSGTWIFADVSRQTSWNYDSNDVRTVVLANSSIRNTATANQLAIQILDEFTKKNYVKTIEIIGSPDIEIADTVYINSNYFSGLCLVTTMAVSVNSNGMITTLVLDQRCPRLFGVWDISNNYVYIGTQGSGVKRKLLNGSTWEDYSTGLTNLNITDLDVNNGKFVCTTSGGSLFLRDVTSSGWSVFTPSGFYNRLNIPSYMISANDGNYVACAINKTNNEIYGLFTNNVSSWVTTITSSGNYINSLIVTLSGLSTYDYNHIGYDLEDIGNSILVSTYTGITAASGLFSEGTGIQRNKSSYISNATSTYNTAMNMSYGSLDAVTLARCWYENYYFRHDTNKAWRVDASTGETININNPGGYSFYASFGVGVVLDENNYIVFKTHATDEKINYIVRFNFEDETSSVIHTESDATQYVGVWDASAVKTDTDVRCIFIASKMNPGAAYQNYYYYKYFDLSNFTVSSETTIATWEELYATSKDEWGLDFAGSKFDDCYGRFFLTYKEQQTNAAGGGAKVKLIVINALEGTFESTVKTMDKEGSISVDFTPFDSISSYANQKFYLMYRLIRITPTSTEYVIDEIDFSGNDTNIKTSATTWNKFSSSKYTTYLIYNDGTVETLAGTGGVTSIPVPSNISRTADDNDNSLIIYRNFYPGRVYKVSPGNTLTILIDDWIYGDATPTLFLEKILLGSVLFSNGAWQTTIYPSVSSVLKKQADSLIFEDVFTKVFDSQVPLKLDASLESPIVLFSPGQVLLYTTPAGDLGTFSLLDNINSIYDVREFYSSSGIYTLLATSSGVFKFPYTGGSGLSLVPVYSGFYRKVETNNHGYYSTPYIFVGTSGLFFQKNPDIDTFTDYSYSLPMSNITVIRMDDSL